MNGELLASVMTTHIIALGGSLLRPEEAEKRVQWFGQLRQMSVLMEGNDRKLGFVIGGGLPAREGIEIAKTNLSDSYKLDMVGIAATRLNATIIQQMLLDIGCNVSMTIPTTTDEAAGMFESNNIVVMGGTTPGHTTDAVAVALARDSGASYCVIATNVSHVYDSDPKKNPSAQPIEELTHDELLKITGDEPLKPGQSAAVDPVAVRWASESGIRIAVLDGRDIQNLEDAIEGKEFSGTLVKSE